MANPEHIAWLLEGVESWNARLEKTASHLPARRVGPLCYSGA